MAGEPRKKINLFGIDVTVTNEAEFMEDTGGTGEHIHMVTRVADCDDAGLWPAVLARRFTVRCLDCKELCWFDPKSSLVPGLGQIICIPCLPARLDREKEESGEGVL